MSKVNLSFLSDILNPLTGGADDDEQIELYKDLDVNNSLLIKKIIEKNIKPEFDIKSLSYKRELKKALAFALLNKDIKFDRIFNSNLIAFEHPRDPRDFFMWIWRVLFKDDELQFEDFSKYKVVEDENEVIRLSTDRNFNLPHGEI